MGFEKIEMDFSNYISNLRYLYMLTNKLNLE